MAQSEVKALLAQIFQVPIRDPLEDTLPTQVGQLVIMPTIKQDIEPSTLEDLVVSRMEIASGDWEQLQRTLKACDIAGIQAPEKMIFTNLRSNRGEPVNIEKYPRPIFNQGQELVFAAHNLSDISRSWRRSDRIAYAEVTGPRRVERYLFMRKKGSTSLPQPQTPQVDTSFSDNGFLTLDEVIKKAA